jgi:hypothetical protein
LDKNNLGEKSALCLSQLFQTCREIGSLGIEELSLDDNPIGTIVSVYVCMYLCMYVCMCRCVDV